MENIKFDLILAGGMFVDPVSGVIEKKDIAVRGDKIAAVDTAIPPSSSAKVVDVSGLYVTPGLIDMHCHLHPNFPLQPDSLSCLHPDAHLFQEGVTTAADTGSVGPRDFIYFKERILDKARARLFAYINVADGGMVNLAREQDPAHFIPEIAAAMAKSYPAQVVGIKTAHYWVGKPFDKEHPPWAAVDAAVTAAELCQMPALIDFQPNLPERTYQELLLHRMRPGDIHTHMYAQQFPILDESGKVCEYIWQARKRGILFDLGHGAGSFMFRNAVPSFEQGHLPDTLSTDLHMANIAGPVIGMTHILSKYLSMGMELIEVIRRATAAPAKILGFPELGRLCIDSPADITVLELKTGEFGFPDTGGARMKGDKRLTCAMTLRAGQVVYDPDARSLPDWQTGRL